MHAILPPELWDRIIDFLYDDHDALRHCALVCRDWAPSSVHHIFNAVNIVPDPDDIPSSSHIALSISRLNSLAGTNPALLQHVESVHTRLCSNLLNSELLQVLGCSNSNLRTLVIDAQPDIFCESPLSASLPQLFPRLHTLVLQNVLFESVAAIASQLHPLRSLKRLELRHTMLCLPQVAPENTIDSEPSFDDCEVLLAMNDWAVETSLPAFWPWLSAASESGRLRVVSLELMGVRVDVDGTRNEVWPAVLLAHAPWLKTVSLGLRDRGGEHELLLPAELAECTSLEHLSISASVPCWAADDDDNDTATPQEGGGSAHLPIIDTLPQAATATNATASVASAHNSSLRCLVGTTADRVGPILRAGTLRSLSIHLKGVQDAQVFDWAALAALPWQLNPQCECSVTLDGCRDGSGVDTAHHTGQLAVTDALSASIPLLRVDTI